MVKDSKKGFVLQGTIILVTLSLILFLFVMPTKPVGPSTGPYTGTTVSGGRSFSSIFFGEGLAQGGVTSTGASNYTDSIYIGSGNASYSFQPSEEYITVTNSSSKPVNITGWMLKNNKDKQPVEIGGRLRHYQADYALIPTGTLLLSPDGRNSFQNIVLGDGEMAILTTGFISLSRPYKIVSFKENMCTGYIEDLGDYGFFPPLERDCPDPSTEPGIELMTNSCREFIERMPRCHTPEFGGKDFMGESCRNCVDGQKLENICTSFIKEHFSYRGCIANHLYDPNFSKRTWRVFLGKRFEMWGEKREVISVFDQFGKLVDSLSY
jgi:hypothetical protein